MSGGSLEYVGYAMRDGDLDKFLRYADSMTDELSRLCAAIAFGKVSHLDEDWRQTPMTAEQIDEAVRAVGLALHRMMDAHDAIRNALPPLQQMVQQLAPIGVTLDRLGSGDDGDECVVKTIVEWSKKP